MRTCILRGVPLAVWLHDGAHIGEEGPVLSSRLHHRRVAALLSKSIRLFLPKSAKSADELRPSDIVLKARGLIRCRFRVMVAPYPQRLEIPCQILLRS
ncbi:hypothetical protein GGR53DRAFT_503670 [Hypoxylon sp. FL1150]|nr:hypothetical protein GGR53DRAFT_503670 [Hypoxylon sp. FL1150]